jgi:hypothetical protein
MNYASPKSSPKERTFKILRTLSLGEGRVRRDF